MSRFRFEGSHSHAALLQGFIVLALLGTTLVSPALAADVRRMVLSDGTEIEYAVALPADFQSAREYPALLAFPGGRQTMESVKAGLERYWEREAVNRGYVLFSPAAPIGKPFYEEGAELIPEFLQRLLSEFKIAGRQFHVAGSSNGGVSAFVAAVRYPQYFQSLTVLAGFPVEQSDFDRLDRLHNMRIAMFVGAGDLYWKTGMEKTRDHLVSLGQRVYFEVVPRNGHFLPDLSFERSTRIFEHIGRPASIRADCTSKVAASSP